MDWKRASARRPFFCVRGRGRMTKGEARCGVNLYYFFFQVLKVDWFTSIDASVRGGGRGGKEGGRCVNEA